MIGTYPDLPWWKENSDKGNSSKGTTRTARSLWPMSLAARRRLDGWRSDGSDADEGSHVETLGTIDLPYGDLGEASTKRSRGEPASMTPSTEPGLAASESKGP